MVKMKKASKSRKGSWTQGDLKLLTDKFPNMPTAQIASKLGRAVDAVKKKASRMGLRKSKKYLKALGRS